MSRLVEYAALVGALLLLSVLLRTTVLPLVTYGQDRLHGLVERVQAR